jgi:hypothetical protein
VALTMKDLEALWPEGPVFTYRRTIEHIESFEKDVVCASKQADSPKCWDLRLAVVGLLRVEASRIESTRAEHQLNPKSWLMTSMAVNWFCCIFLEGVR